MVTVTLVPSGVWVRALSSRIRMICRTRSGSATATTGRSGARNSRREPRRSARGPNSRATSRASELRSTLRIAITMPPASSWERLRRSAVSLVSRSICWRIVRTNSARSSGLGSSSSSSSTKPPRLKIGVRSSCDALAMNCLRALSSSARRRCISLKVRASWPSWPEESTGMRAAKSPSATLRAASSIRCTRTATSCAK